MRWILAVSCSLALIACGSDTAVTSTPSTSTGEVAPESSSASATEAPAERSETVIVVDSKIDRRFLVVDYSTVETTRSMKATLYDESGNRVGMFVHRNASGTGRYFPSSDPGLVAVPDGEISEETDTFLLDGLDPGSYELCSDLGASSEAVCTFFELPLGSAENSETGDS